VLSLLAKLTIRVDVAQRTSGDQTRQPSGVVVIDEIETHLHLSAFGMLEITAGECVAMMNWKFGNSADRNGMMSSWRFVAPVSNPARRGRPESTSSFRALSADRRSLSSGEIRSTVASDC
jgi:hypothetical protein